MIAALTASIVAPAKAGPSGEPLLPATSASLPKIVVQDLIDPNGQPTLAQQEQQPAPAQPEARSGPDANSDIPAAVRPSGDLAAMVTQLRTGEAGNHELDCLATGIYFESKGEPLAGQLAVGKVIANRAKSGGRFPPSYCGVLFQRGQFSFVHGRSLPAVPRANKQWQTAVAVAKIVDQNLKESAAGDALFFHAKYVSAAWHATRVAAIGNHIFYR